MIASVAGRWFPVALFTLLMTVASTAATRQLRAGAATSNITPGIGAGIVGIGTTAPPSGHIHDELHVRCLVLDDGATKLAIVVCDNLHATRPVYDLAKTLVAAGAGIPADHVLISSTHTHSGPSAMGDYAFKWGEPLDDYQRFMARRIADGVRRAVNQLEPARIGWGVGRVPQHLFNRRWKMKAGTPLPNPFGGTDRVLMNPGARNPRLLEPAGPTDPEVSFISVQSSSGRPLALLANYSLHYVGGVAPGDISADYYGIFCDRIQQLLGADRQDPPFVGIMSNGTSGDVNNNDLTGPPVRHAMYAKMRIVAHDVAAEVHRVQQTIGYRDWVPLGAAQTEIQVGVRKPTPAMLERARAVMAIPDIKLHHRREGDYAARLIALDEWPDQVAVIVQAMRIGGLGIAAIPYETFTEIGLEIKSRSPFKPAFTISLANGWGGYLPTPEQHELGGYETWMGTSLPEVGASPRIISALMQLFDQLK